ncbi:MAG TPA: hypothetical protein VHZ73_13415 [Vicinamibacterales bacterium]|nr:hypothetical protein [Vicinamibacterales bacterium]
MRPVRWLVCAIAVLALAASGYFAFHSEEQITEQRGSLRAFEQSAREAASSLSDLRANEQAYAAAGQSVAALAPKVAALVDSTAQSIDSLRTTALSSDARAALLEAAASVQEFRNVDKRARDYFTSNQALMAADVVFTEGGETATNAARQVDTASVAEHQAFDQFEGAQKKAQMYAAAGGGAIALLSLVLLAGGGSARETAVEETNTSLSHSVAPAQQAAPAAPVDAPRTSVPALKTAAALCTEFGQVRDVTDLTKLMARAADALEASGLVVWLGDSRGGDLRPVLTHGYAPELLAKMPSIPRSANNAAAAAYRTASFQIVLARPGKSAGALVAPLLGPDGCIGALTAEIKGGAESADSVQALASIFAAQLAGVLATVPADENAPARVAAQA